MNECWIELILFDCNTWNHLTVCKQMSSCSFKNCYLQTNSFTNHIEYICINSYALVRLGSLVWQPVYKKVISEFKPSLLCWKIHLVSHSMYGCGVGYILWNITVFYTNPCLLILIVFGCFVWKVDVLRDINDLTGSLSLSHI